MVFRQKNQAKTGVIGRYKKGFEGQIAFNGILEESKVDKTCGKTAG
jgi:hypothetical protein